MEVDQKKKRFLCQHVPKIRKYVSVLVTLNVILGFAVMKVYFNQPERQFYATNGVGAPEELTAMDEANMTSVPLLPDDPAGDGVDKVIPQ